MVTLGPPVAATCSVQDQAISQMVREPVCEGVGPKTVTASYLLYSGVLLTAPTPSSCVSFSVYTCEYSVAMLTLTINPEGFSFTMETCMGMSMGVFRKA